MYLFIPERFRFDLSQVRDFFGRVCQDDPLPFILSRFLFQLKNAPRGSPDAGKYGLGGGIVAEIPYLVSGLKPWR
jgi:hypothetical protein